MYTFIGNFICKLCFLSFMNLNFEQVCWAQHNFINSIHYLLLNSTGRPNPCSRQSPLVYPIVGIALYIPKTKLKCSITPQRVQKPRVGKHSCKRFCDDQIPSTGPPQAWTKLSLAKNKTVLNMTKHSTFLLHNNQRINTKISR